eukprot:CAMPEP_0170510472 /NCGR_PEP_ID=MMETSP0208-20121228/65784_1 /TAXON_ID=197538 /ORGANISM="Strombidium inclinatum, Strain S3" /LENGTH=176 /DNA_ID=CAMNT_0010793937 /DNA_START=461 /DNA_END=991 /DNA_ORIENTATION=+
MGFVRFNRQGSPLKRTVLGTQSAFEEKKVIKETEQRIGSELTKLMIQSKSTTFREKLHVKKLKDLQKKKLYQMKTSETNFKQIISNSPPGGQFFSVQVTLLGGRKRAQGAVAVGPGQEVDEKKFKKALTYTVENIISVQKKQQDKREPSPEEVLEEGLADLEPPTQDRLKKAFVQH